MHPQEPPNQGGWIGVGDVHDGLVVLFRRTPMLALMYFLAQRADFDSPERSPHNPR